MTSGTAGGNAGESVRKGVGMFHGVGEAIRGNVNAFVDKAAGDHESAAKNEAIASRGADEMDHGYHRNTTTGSAPTTAAVTPMTANTTTGSTNVQPNQTQGEYYAPQPGTGSTNNGPHNTNIGNNLDPRFDSQPGLAVFDLRRSQTDGPSSIFGGHSTDVDNKSGRRSGSDHGRRASTSLNSGPHSTNLGNKLDPRYDSDRDHRGAPSNHGPHSTKTGNKMDPFVDSDRDHREAPPNHGPHSTNIGNKIDPRYDSDRDHRGAPDGNLGTDAFNTAAREFMANSVREHAMSISPAHSFNQYSERQDQHGLDYDQGDYDQGDHEHAVRRQQSGDQYSHDHYEPRAGEVEPHSRPVHRSSTLNRLDPRINSKHDPYYYHSDFYSSLHRDYDRERFYQDWNREASFHQGNEAEPAYGLDAVRGPPYHQDYPPTPPIRQYHYQDSFDRPVSSMYRRDSAPNGPFTSAYEDADSRPPANQLPPQQPGDMEQRPKLKISATHPLPLLPPQGHIQALDFGGAGGKEHGLHAQSIREPEELPRSAECPHQAGWLTLVDSKVDMASVMNVREAE